VNPGNVELDRVIFGFHVYVTWNAGYDYENDKRTFDNFLVGGALHRVTPTGEPYFDLYLGLWHVRVRKA